VAATATATTTATAAAAAGAAADVVVIEWADIECVCAGKPQPDVVSEKVVRQVTSESERNRATLHAVEGLALVMLCSSKPIIRKQAVIVLKESRNLFTVLDVPKVRLILAFFLLHLG